MNIDKNIKEKLKKEMGPLSFAMFMKVARTTLGITQEEMGKILKISKSNICDIEKGRQLVSADLAIKLAKKAGLPEQMAVLACLQDQAREAGSKVILKTA